MNVYEEKGLEADLRGDYWLLEGEWRSTWMMCNIAAKSQQLREAMKDSHILFVGFIYSCSYSVLSVSPIAEGPPARPTNHRNML